MPSPFVTSARAARNRCWFRALVLVASLLELTQAGCVRRRLTIRSNPPGALAYVDNFPVGTTPCSTDFLYYGTRQIRLVKDGYETLTVNQPIPAPWYQVPPIDFFSENLMPREIRDEQTLNYNLVPQVIAPSDQVLSRAEGLRRGARGEAPMVAPASGWVTPPAPAPGVPTSLGGPRAQVLQAPGAPAPQTLPPGGQPPRYAPPP